MIKFLRLVISLINVIIVVALLSIHFIFKECSFKASVFYYAFPLPIIIGMVLILSIFITHKLRKYNLLLAAVLMLIWLVQSFKIHIPKTITDEDLEIVLWNASRENNLEDAFKINDGIPDILVMVEHGSYKTNFFNDKYPNYHFYKSDAGISIFSKSPLKIINEASSKFNTNFIHFETSGVNFYAIDVHGSIDVPRSWELGFVNKLIKNTKHTVILGDFNIPYESKHFESIKVNFDHAFSKRGNGFKETWPWNIPLLSLDHIWASKDLKILKTKKVATFTSDHSMVKTYIRK